MGGVNVQSRRALTQRGAEMTTPDRPGPAERGAWHASRWYLALALAVMAGAATVLLGVAVSDTSSTPGVVATTPPAKPVAVVLGAAPSRSAAPAAATAGGAAVHAAPIAEGDNDPTRDLSSYVMRGEKPTMNQVIERLHQAGIHTGLGAFNPPGTRPNLVGLAVPEDFVLPPGYVRHHQSTDDGQPVEAMLMFAPDAKLFNAAHQPIVLPQNRVVPPELAPPGLPLRYVTIPAPPAGGRAPP